MLLGDFRNRRLGEDEKSKYDTRTVETRCTDLNRLDTTQYMMLCSRPSSSRCFIPILCPLSLVSDLGLLANDNSSEVSAYSSSMRNIAPESESSLSYFLLLCTSPWGISIGNGLTYNQITDIIWPLIISSYLPALPSFVRFIESTYILPRSL
jgi:hypothetical protein